MIVTIKIMAFGFAISRQLKALKSRPFNAHDRPLKNSVLLRREREKNPAFDSVLVEMLSSAHFFLSIVRKA